MYEINSIENRNFLGFVLPVCHDIRQLPVLKIPSPLLVADLSLDCFGTRVGPQELSAYRSAKISQAQFVSGDLLKMLVEHGMTTIFVDLAATGNDAEREAFLARITDCTKGHARGVRIVPIVGEATSLEGLARHGYVHFPIALKGYEASGLCGMEPVSVLFDGAVAYHGWSPRDIIIWGGIATAEAAAAFFVLGVRGIVHESLHWLTSAATPSPALRAKFSVLSPDHTAVVGEATGLPIRLYDKGNSRVIRELKAKEEELFDVDPFEARSSFLAQVSSIWKQALSDGLGSDKAVPLGPEAALSRHFVERYGEDFLDAVAKYAEEIVSLCERAPHLLEDMRFGRAAKALGTEYPILQGGMSCITDKLELASLVADAGALPTLAVGLKSRAELEREFAELSATMGGRPYAVNILALDENPRLQEQISWVEALRPPFVVIAAGSPSYVRRLWKLGMKVVYIAQSEGLLRLAAKEGATFIVLEGNEAGGHVGALTSLTLAQMALTLRRAEPNLFKETHLVLAGGICNRVSTLRAAMLGADAVQMGTAYLACKEMVETGALSQPYQEAVLTARPGDTSVTGHQVGLRVRALRSPKVEAIRRLEREMTIQGLDEHETRGRIEALCAGSLLIAARQIKAPGADRLEKEVCLREGQFMCGAVAGNVNRSYSLPELHAELFAAVSPLCIPVFAERKGPLVGKSSRIGRERVAITGMAMNNCLGRTVAEVWANTKALRCGITEVPQSRWNHADYFHAEPGRRGKTYCSVAAFQNLTVTRKEIGVPPHDFLTMCQSTRMTLWLAKNALEGSGLLSSDIPRERIGVIVSQNSGEMGSTVPDLVVVAGADGLVQDIRHVAHLSDAAAEAAAAILRNGRVAVDDTTLLGRLNSAAGGFICNQYGLRGPAFSVGAACATGLVALWSAYGMIRAGILDAAVVGGSEELLLPATFMEFSALRALAGASNSGRPQTCRPFDAHRDGMVLGEGGAIVVIERESSAKRRGAEIHAFLEGMGASNNDRGMVESVAENQQIAIGNAFLDAGWEADSVDLIECHATATIQGDVEEVKALKAVISRGTGITLSSYKSQIGHTLGASGLMSLLRGVCAMKESIFPATLNYETPDPAIGLEEWGFRVPQTVEEWVRPRNRKRRLEVNSFGFGGSNFVALLEESQANGHAGRISARPEISHEHPREIPAECQRSSVHFFVVEDSNGSQRIAVTAASEAEAMSRLHNFSVADGLEDRSAARLRVLVRQGIFVESTERQPGELGLLFAGQGTVYAGMGASLYQSIPSFKQRMDYLASLLDGYPILDILFSGNEEGLKSTRLQQPALFIVEYALARELLELGIAPACLAGHSTGELTALCFAGVFSPEDGLRIVDKRAQCMANASKLVDDPGVMLAIDADAETLEPVLRDHPDLFITNLNSPTQTVIGGGTRETLIMGDKLCAMGYRAVKLNVSMVFHSPRMRVIRDELQTFLDGIPFRAPNIPVISNATGKEFPNDPETIKQIVLDNLESPVLWTENMRNMREGFGVRTFLEIGPSDVLCSMVQATFPDALAIPSCLKHDPPQALATAIAELYRYRFIDPPGVRRLAPGKWSVESFDREAALSVVQREVVQFALEGVARYLKPAVLKALRREVSPDIGEHDASNLLQVLLQNSTQMPLPAPCPTDSKEFTTSPPRAGTPAVLPEVEFSDHAGGVLPDADPVVEAVIQIIMEVTGYERDEIAPDMDIRKDLTIRSSRLPVIMDAAEQRFAISIEVMDFITVRTVRDIAETIKKLIGRQGGEAGLKPAVSPSRRIAEEVPLLSRLRGERPSIVRHTFIDLPLADMIGKPLSLGAGKTIVVATVSPSGDLFRALEQVLHPLGVKIRTVTDMTSEEIFTTMRNAKDDLAGLVILDVSAEDESTKAIPHLISWFKAVQCFMAAPHGSFAFYIRNRRGVLFEGVLGMFLAAAQEKPGTLFRCVELRAGSDPHRSLSVALSCSSGPVELIAAGNGTFTTTVQPVGGELEFDRPQLLPEGGAVVLTGGARGITTSIARVLAARGYPLVLAGTTPLDPAIDYERIFRKSVLVDEALSIYLGTHGLNPDPETRKRIRAGMEVYSSLIDVRKYGVEVVYRVCDVTDASQVRSLIEETVTRHGAVEGVVHGAGVLRDSFLSLATPEDFAAVCRVKCDGSSHLFQETRDRGLKFFATFSSLAAYQGNIGQANYCAANRMLAALMSDFCRQAPSVRFKTLWLPPIEGAGMAEDPEIREILTFRSLDAAYMDLGELARFFELEMFLNEAGDHCVLPARFIPTAPTVVDIQPLTDTGTCGRVLLGQHLKPGHFPLVDLVESYDPAGGRITTLRRFSLSNDPWLEDHRPVAFIGAPLVSAIVGTENMLEAAKLLAPGFIPVRIESLSFLDFIPVPPESTVETRCLGQLQPSELLSPILAAVIEARGPEGGWTPRFSGRVHLARIRPDIPATPGFPLRHEEIETGALTKHEVMGLYEKHTHLTGRYRVLRTIEGFSPNAIKGTMLYHETDDFRFEGPSHYLYSLYILEACLHMVSSFVAVRDELRRRSIVPVYIETVLLGRSARNGEEVAIEGRLLSMTEAGVRFDCRASDERGEPLMLAQGISFRWIDG